MSSTAPAASTTRVNRTILPVSSAASRSESVGEPSCISSTSLSRACPRRSIAQDQPGADHESEPAGLNQYQDDDLPKKIPVVGGADGDEPGHRSGRNRGVECIDGIGRIAAFRGQRRRQEQRPERNDRSERARRRPLRAGAHLALAGAEVHSASESRRVRARDAG